ncbi:MAG TPA: peptidylprolyl isomerase [Planctomycetota bacterium]|nr:peptidylprolyl isomerase [Planctomycetota bacterium]
MVLELFEDTAPNTVANIISLSETGYYNGVKFHRIIAGFMAQGGDPQGTGMGGPGYTIKDELKGNPRFHWRGTLSMAHAGPNTGGSQFFLCFSPTPHLNDKHTVFGRIIEGQEVADELERGDEIVKATVLRKRDHEYKVETHAAQRPPMRLPPGSVHPH